MQQQSKSAVGLNEKPFIDHPDNRLELGKMASSKPSYSWRDITSAEQKKVPLPDRFLCRECKKLKSPPQYSNKQLSEYRFKVSQRTSVNGITAQLRCRNCTGDQTQELQCTGPCTLWKGIDDFSKNQRRHPENAWCVSCTQWKEANEPGITPMAPPNTLLSPDEEREVAETETGFGAYSTEDIEGEADSDDDEAGFIYDKMAHTSVDDDGMAGSNGQRGKVSGSHAASAALPGYLKGSRITSNVLQTRSSLNNPYDNRSEYTGEGGKQQSDNTMSGPGKGMKGKGQPYGAGTSLSVGDGKKSKPGIGYNAWDNVGQIHSQYRTPSQSTAITGSTGLPSRQDVQPVSSGASGWAKQTMATRNPPPQFPALSRPIKQSIYDDDDDDDSPDEL